MFGHLKWIFSDFFFQVLLFTLTASSKKVENNSACFLKWRTESENLVENNEDSRVFMSFELSV